MQLIPEIVVRYRSPFFAHIFSGGYAAGYYSYIWAEVLVQDAFQAFKEKGLFDQATAKSFRENILERGGTDDAMKLYERFRGRKPTIEPLLQKRGLSNFSPDESIFCAPQNSVQLACHMLTQFEPQPLATAPFDTC
ncbi:MAG: peptidase [Bacteroidetes bacterium]|nr:peptidase [Bacteroidota bacterium]